VCFWCICFICLCLGSCIINRLSGTSENELHLKQELIHKNVFTSFLPQVSSFSHAALQIYKAIPNLLHSLVQWVGLPGAKSSKYLDGALKKAIIPLGWSRSCLCFNLQPVSREVVRTHLCFGQGGKVRVCGAWGTSSPRGRSEEGFGGLILASPSTTPSPLGVFQTIYPLMTCCTGFVRKKHFIPRNDSNNDGVEDNFNDTVLAPVHSFREIYPSQNSDHFRTRDKSFS